MKVATKPVVMGLAQVLLAGMVYAQSPAQWTFLVYLDGDNNLEEAGIDDFLEMSSVGSNDDVKIVVLFDRASGYDTSYDDWTDARRGVINPGDVPDTSWGESIGEVNMGDPQTLVDFVLWGMQNYPASRYAVVLWDHGDGWQKSPERSVKAVCSDYSSGDQLYMAEVRSALADIETAEQEPDLVGFDACLMGMVEVAYEIRAHAGVMVGSEHTEPGDGWPYDTIMQDLVADPSMDAAGLGIVIVDRYYESYGNNQTQSAIDLSQMDGLAADVDLFAQTLRDNWSSSILACVTAAGSVMTAVGSAVIHEQHGSSWPGSHGLAIYFPESAGGFDPDYNGSVILFPGATRWEEFLQDYYSSMGGSWVQCARDQSQEFYYLAHIDLYDFCEGLMDCAPDDLGVQPAEDFSSSGAQGGPFDPAGKEYTLTNMGSDPLDWEATWTADWVDVTPVTSGTLVGGGSTTVEVCVSADANSLLPGRYSDTVTFTNLTSGLAQTRDVELIVGGGAAGCVLDADFESGLADFTIDNGFGDGNGLWHLTTACQSPTSDHTIPTSLYFGVDAQCDYNTALAAEGVVTSSVISLADLALPIELSFNYFLETEGIPGQGYDQASVEVSVSGGPFSAVAHNDPGAAAVALADPSGGWLPATVDLSAMAGSTVQVRFRFRTGDEIYNDYEGFYVDDVKICSTSPQLLGAVSRRNHGGEGELDIDLPLDPPEQAGTETRRDGPQKVVLTFSENVEAHDGVPDETEVSLTCGGSPCGTLESVSMVGSEMTIEMSGVPDETCLAITLSAIVDEDGNPLAGDNDVHIRVLAGDTNRDGNTNLIDMAQVKSMNGADPAVPGNTRFDVNVDGDINLIDMALVKSLNGGSVTCP